MLRGLKNVVVLQEALPGKGLSLRLHCVAYSLWRRKIRYSMANDCRQSRCIMGNNLFIDQLSCMFQVDFFYYSLKVTV